MQIKDSLERCPRCMSHAHIQRKLILIGKASPKLLFGSEEKAGYRRKDQLAVDECKRDMIHSKPLEQFIDGYYCERCVIGFVADEILTSTEN